MPAYPSRTIEIYTDGSHRRREGGAGVVLSWDDRIVLRSARVDGATDSLAAERAAAALGIESALQLVRGPATLLMAIDNDLVRRQVAGTLRRGEPDDALARQVEDASARGFVIEVRHLKSHGNGIDDYSGDDDFLFGVADRLAALARSGLRFSAEVDKGEDWRGAIVALHGLLDPARRNARLGMSVEEVSKDLDLPREVVLELVRHGHLHLQPGVGAIDENSAIRLRGEVRRLRREMPRE